MSAVKKSLLVLYEFTFKSTYLLALSFSCCKSLYYYLILVFFENTQDGSKHIKLGDFSVFILFCGNQLL